MAKQSTSFGHKVEALADDEARHWSGNPDVKGPRWNCAKCDGPPAVYATSFRYVTGRAGRTTDRWQAVCLNCAAVFAAKHGLTLPEVPADTQD